jgi:hypothetical protein
MSLPSHFRQKERRPLTATSFVPPSFRLNRALSQSSGDIPSGQSYSTPEPHPQSTRNIERRHTMKEHRPINYNQAPPTRANVTTSSETALHQSPVHEARAQVQHLAIESSDIVGWTADGRLIVQMPANQGMPEVGVATVNPAPIRRASTGQFAQDQSFPQLKHGSSDILAPPAQQSSQKAPPKSLQHSVSDKTIRNRPLPPTPLDMVLPNSAVAARTRPVLTATQVPVTTTLTNGPFGNTYRPSFPPSTTNVEPFLSHTTSGAPSVSLSATNEVLPRPASHTHSDSVEASLQEVTDQMSRALAQFDDLLGVVQTSL